MKILRAVAFLPPFSADTEGYVEAVGTTRITGLKSTCPAWSPDGTRIAFECTRDGKGRSIAWARTGRTR